jgi:heme exporter protein B
MKAFLAVLQRDMRLAWRQSSEWFTPLAFFLLVLVLFPLAISPETKTLSLLAAGAIWIAALLAVLLSLDQLFRQDFEDGSLEQLRLSTSPFVLLVLAKVLAHWLQTGFCLLLLSPIAALLFFLDVHTSLVLALTLLLGTPVLSLLGAMAAALTVSLRRANVLIPLLTLPLMVPVIVFATAAVKAAAQGLPISGFIAVLAGFLVLSITLLPWVIASALELSSS